MRPVPRLIDSNSRLGEHVMVFMVPLFVLRTTDPMVDRITGACASAIYIRATLGKPEGYLVHRLYRLGIPLTGPLDRRVRRLVP